jgi:NAD(P)H dehydrogenase (quinone)
MPAMLKGFIDRVFTSGFAFKYDDKGLPKGLLKGKEAIVILSTGAPKIASIITGSRFKSHIQKDILQFCGIKTKVYQIDNARELNKGQKKKIKNTVKEAMRS